MQLFGFFSLAAAALMAKACTQCPHPGTFTGSLGGYVTPNPNFCQTTVNSTSIAVSIPSGFYNPPDESPCDETVTITSSINGKKVVALIVGSCTTCTNNGILLTQPGLSALSPDGSPNHAPGTVTWTFNN